MLRHVMLTFSITLLALVASGQGRAINISNTWVLPEEGFPVFYRYFRDRISWYEADAVCQFHHANLVTVDTTAQYDAVRAYLKELDISSAVWVGLIRSNPEGEFTWTDYRGLSGDGYWSSAPDARAAPLCAAADPAADYRWEARACGGPTVASFICELPVPQWALGNQGCMVRALPTLTVLYLPESAAVQLTTDCGLGGIKKVQCTGNVKREDLLKNLSCADDESTTTNSPIQSSSSSITTDNPFIDQEITSETTTEDVLTTVRENISNQPTTQSATTLAIIEQPNVKPQKVINKLNNINIDQVENNNIQSKYPKYLNDVSIKEQMDKVEEEKHLHHKMLYEELARHGEFENIFTQPTDHFVPPLVMAKSKLSDDMTVLSLAEKHAQQIAEDRLMKHTKPEEHLLKINHDKILTKQKTEKPYKIEIIEKPLVMTLHSKLSDSKKKENKYNVPKKYNEKYEDPKSKGYKLLDNKITKIDKVIESPTLEISSTTNKVETTTIHTKKTEENDQETDSIDLTVMLKELGMENTTDSLYSNHSTAEAKKVRINDSFKKIETEDKTTEKITTINQYTETQTTHNIAMNHEVIKITIVEDNPFSSSHSPTVFEFTTKSPVFKDDTTEQTSSQQSGHTTNIVTSTGKVSQMITTVKPSTPEEITAVSNAIKSSSIYPSKPTINDKPTIVTEDMQSTRIPNVNITIQQSTTAETKVTSNIENTTTIQPIQNTEKKNAATATDQKSSSEDYSERSTEALETTSEYQHVTNNADATNQQLVTNERPEYYNFTTIHDDGYAKNWTESLDEIDDSHSPLLSAANEPLHRPNRSRRPQQQNRISKFNPFRILG